MSGFFAGIYGFDKTLLSENINKGTPKYRMVFPSYDWDEDVWRVNQIMNLPYIVGKKYIGFVKNVPNEEVKKSDAAIKKWIDDNMYGCSCFIVFCGEKTAFSKWVKYEIEQANKKNMGRFIISIEGMLNKDSEPCNYCIDPYEFNELYTQDSSNDAYVIKKYSWKVDDGLKNIHSWIEDACKRAGK